MSIDTGDKSDRWFFVIRFAASKVLALILFASCATVLAAQTIQIELVNGKTGRPITDSSKLHVWVGKASGSGTLTVPTDKHGIARLRLTHNDSEINVPQCEGLNEELQKLANKIPKASKQESAELDKKYEGCYGFELKNPVAKYADTIRVNTTPGNVSWKVAPLRIGYVTCWLDPQQVKYSWLSVTEFSTEEILQHGVVTANLCGKATATPQPGHLVLFVRMPTNGETWRQAWE